MTSGEQALLQDCAGFKALAAPPPLPFHLVPEPDKCTLLPTSSSLRLSVHFTPPAADKQYLATFSLCLGGNTIRHITCFGNVSLDFSSKYQNSEVSGHSIMHIKKSEMLKCQT